MTPAPTRRATARVLVLGEESRVVLPVIRSLARIGVEVDLGWCPAHEPARYSRHVAANVDLAAPGEPGAVAELVAHVTRASHVASRMYDLVVPATESATWALHADRAGWVGLPIAIGPEHALDVAFDKTATHALARSLDISVPAAVDVGDGDDVAAAVEKAGLVPPFVAKPARSIDPDGLTKVAVHIVAGIPELNAAVAHLLPGAGAVQIQEYVAGAGVGVEVLAADGEVLYAFQHRRLHESTGYGSTYRESVPLDPELLDAATALVAALDHTGVAMFEFRVEESCGGSGRRPGRRWVLLEINPRFWGSLPLSVAAGADFPADLYEMARFGRRRFPGTYTVGVRSRDLLNDLRWMWRQRSAPGGVGAFPHAGEDGWGVNVVDRRTLARDVGRLVTFRDPVDLFDRRDPMPTIHELRRVGEMGVRVARRTAARTLRRSPDPT